MNKIQVACLFSFFIASSSLVLGQVPHFGNAMRNGWATQDSIVIWTRTTAQAEMTRGPDFVSVPKGLASQLLSSGEEDRLVTSQMPKGMQLEQMLGSLPGMPAEVRLVYGPVGKPDKQESTAWRKTSEAQDCTAQWKLTELMPGTEYLVTAEARVPGNDPISRCEGRFQTAPAADENADLKFCVTTCHDFLRRDDGEKGHKIYPSMTRFEPDFVVHAGDIEYYDKEKPYAWTKELMRFKWARLFSMPRNREFYATHSSYFIKDDHDTLKNDSWPGQSYGTVTFEEGVRLFNEEQFPTRDPRYDSIRWGKDLEIWVLEGRDYRSANTMEDGPEKTILGAEQKRWLMDSLRRSNATFKLVFSPTPIVGPDRANKKDNHANRIFAHEGEELREFFSTVDGLILFCGDRHWQYASVDAEHGIWEFGCGPGSEKHQLGWKKGDVRPVHRFLRVAGGYLSGEMTYVDSKPILTLNHRDVYGVEKSSFTFPTIK